MHSNGLFYAKERVRSVGKEGAWHTLIDVWIIVCCVVGSKMGGDRMASAVGDQVRLMPCVGSLLRMLRVVL